MKLTRLVPAGRPAERRGPSVCRVVHRSALLLAVACAAGCSQSDGPADARTLFERAQILNERREAEQALTALDEAIGLDPTEGIYFYERGVSHEQLGSLDAAVADYTAAIEKDPEIPWAYINRASLFGRQGDLSAAAADLDEAIRLDPGDAMAYLNRSLAYEELGRPDDALADLELAEQLDPDIAETARRRGLILLQLGRTEDALAAFDESIFRDESLAAAHRDRATALESLGRTGDAAASLEAALRWDAGLDLADEVERLRSAGSVRDALAAAGYEVIADEPPAGFDLVARNGDADLAVLVTAPADEGSFEFTAEELDALRGAGRALFAVPTTDGVRVIPFTETEAPRFRPVVYEADLP